MNFTHGAGAKAVKFAYGAGAKAAPAALQARAIRKVQVLKL